MKADVQMDACKGSLTEKIMENEEEDWELK
jgi:hypothetical protein